MPGFKMAEGGRQPLRPTRKSAVAARDFFAHMSSDVSNDSLGICEDDSISSSDDDSTNDDNQTTEVEESDDNIVSGPPAKNTPR
jgi:hypothetical protein